MLVQQSLCAEPPVVGSFHFPTDVSPQAKFFVGLGVVSMLYALLALAGYVLLNETYIGKRAVPTAVSCGTWWRGLRAQTIHRQV